MVDIVAQAGIFFRGGDRKSVPLLWPQKNMNARSRAAKTLVRVQ